MTHFDVSVVNYGISNTIMLERYHSLPLRQRFDKRVGYQIISLHLNVDTNLKFNLSLVEDTNTKFYLSLVDIFGATDALVSVTPEHL